MTGILNRFIDYKLNGKMSANRQTMEIAYFRSTNWTWTVYAGMHSAQVFAFVCAVWMKYSFASPAQSSIYANISSLTLTKSLLLCCMHECVVVVIRHHRQHYTSNKKIRWKKRECFQMFSSLARLLWMENLFHLPLTITCWLVVYDFMNRSHAFPYALTGIWILAQAFNRFSSFYYRQNGCVA